MKNFIYIAASLLYSINSFSQTEIYITNDVSSGRLDFQVTDSYIEANHTINNGSTAIYQAGEYIRLNEGFFADTSSLALMVTYNGTTSSKNLQENVASLNESDLLEDQFQFTVYPNPSNGVYTLKSSNNIVSYAITNVVGKQILAGEINSDSFTIDITKFSSGFYLLELQKETGETIKKKIIKN